MIMAKKVVYIASEHRDRVTVYAGTVEDLASNVFSYKLDCGHSWNSRINRYPKTTKQLIRALEMSVEETQGGCYNRDYYFETTEEEANSRGWNIRNV